MLKPVTIISKEKLTNPRFISTSALNIIRDSHTMQWEMINSLPTVHILVNKVDSQEILLVKQVRPPVLYNNNAPHGECIEVCAGLVDKYSRHHEDSQTALVAKEEVLEELGYTTSYIQRLQPILGSVGTAGTKLHLFYTEVTDANFVGQQLEPTEDIEVVKLSYENVLNFINTTSNTDSTTIMLLQWFLLNKRK